MDTDKKTQTLQTNTFAGGMNTDVADSLLKPSEYRLARNLRYVTDTEESTGEMRLVEDYDTLFLVIGEIIATKSIRNYGVIITKEVKTELNEETESNELVTYWRIYRYDSTRPVSSGTNPNPKLIFGPCSDELGDELSIVCRWESDNNVKVYIADGGEIMSINIAPSADLNQLPTNRSFLTTSSSQVLAKPEVEINSSFDATIKGLKIQYAYKLYRYGYQETNISPFSSILRIYKTYDENYNGYNQDEYTSKSVKVTIPQNDIKNTDKCAIYRISYITESLDPIVTLIYDDVYDGQSFYITDTGKSLGTYTIQQLLSEDTIQIEAKIIESKNDYLFASNVTYKLDDFDLYIDLYYDSNDITTTLIQKWYLVDESGNVTSINGAATNSAQCPNSLHTGETYRYGIIFYNKDGVRSSVKHIRDITVPYKPLNTDITGYEQPYSIGDVTTFNLHAIGVNFNISGLDSNIKNNCSGYEIVRCIRDIENTRTLAQGILSKTFTGPLSTHPCFLNPYLTMDSCDLITAYMRNNQTYHYESSLTDKILSFSCPEYCYFPGQFKEIVNRYKNNIKIKPYIDYLPYVTVDTYTTTETHYDSLAESFVSTQLQTDAFFLGDSNLYSTEFRKHTVNSQDSIFLVPPAFSVRKLSYYLDTAALLKYQAVCKIIPKYNTFIQTTQVRNNESFFNINNEYKIYSDSIQFTSSPKPNKFVNVSDTISFNDDKYTVSIKNSNNIINRSYYNWFSDYGFHTVFWTNDGCKESLQNGVHNGAGVLSSGNMSIVFSLEDDISADFINPYESLYTDLRERSMPISIFNLVKDVTDPYGSNDSSTYHSYGNYFKMSDVDAAGFNGVDIFDGDTFNTIFIFNSSHSCYGASTAATYIPQGVPTKYIIPIQTSIDLNSALGELQKDETSANTWAYFLDEPGKYYVYTQEKPAYVYNTAYYTDVRYPVFHSTYYADVYSGNYDTRVVYSLKKDNNEKVDSWSKFKAVNYLDVDSRYGQITDMRLFKNQLLFWLESATGILSSNEQQLILNPNGANLTLGTGDVLLRFDYITTVYGMKAGLFAEEQSNSYIYWWDDNKKKILQYGNGFTVLSDIKNVSNFINTGTSIEKPSIYYNKKYQEIWFSIISKPYIEYYTNPERFEFPKSSEQENTILLFDYPLIYNENLQVFTGVYDTIFRNKLYFNDGDLLVGSDYVNSAVKDGIPNLTPYLKYVVSASSGITKTYDLQEIGGRFYGNSSVVDIDSTTSVENKQNSLDLNNKYHSSKLSPLKFRFTTPLNQQAITNGSNISIREYNLKMDIPRNGGSALYGNRMRGKTMQCELLSTSASKDFALQYITTKFRISCS